MTVNHLDKIEGATDFDVVRVHVITSAASSCAIRIRELS
jgi:hypothetical protein